MLLLISIVRVDNVGTMTKKYKSKTTKAFIKLILLLLPPTTLYSRLVKTKNKKNTAMQIEATTNKWLLFSVGPSGTTRLPLPFVQCLFKSAPHSSNPSNPSSFQQWAEKLHLMQPQKYSLICEWQS